MISRSRAFTPPCRSPANCFPSQAGRRITPAVLSDSGRGPDSGTEHQCGHSADVCRGGGARSEPVSLGQRMGLVAGPLSRQPDQRGKILSSRTRKVDHRLAAALRMAAESLCRDKSYLGQYYRRMRARLGGPQAITAAAQARADHLPPGHHRRGIQRRTLRAHRSQEWREIPAAVGATGSQIGLHPGPGNPHRGGGCFLGGVK